jgi:hypothetical protein
MSPKFLPLVAALTVAGSAHAVTVNMTDFFFGPAATAVITGTNGSPSYDGQAGAFGGTMTDSAPVQPGHNSLAASSPTSFVAWCAELTQNFSFGVSYEYTLVGGTAHFGAQRASDLSRLFTEAAANNFVFDSFGSAAFQAGIWEIIYEQSGVYSFTGGTLTAAADGNPVDPAEVAAFNTVNGFLGNLGQYGANYQINVLENAAQQDFLVATVPEPETWVLLAAGLGVIGLLRRRRKA